MGNPNDSSSYQQVGKQSPKFNSKKQPKWIRSLNVEMGFELDDCFDPIIRAFKRSQSDLEKRPWKKHVYLKKSMKEYKNVLVGCYKKLLTQKDLVRCCHVVIVVFVVMCAIRRKINILFHTHRNPLCRDLRLSKTRYKIK